MIILQMKVVKGIKSIALSMYKYDFQDLLRLSNYLAVLFEMTNVVCVLTQLKPRLRQLTCPHSLSEFVDQHMGLFLESNFLQMYDGPSGEGTLGGGLMPHAQG